MVQLDIPMPKTCYECPCHDGENNSCQVTGKYYYDEILRSCPLIELPSAQQEIICCKDCKHRGEKPINDGRYWCSFHGTFMYYCSDAERRTDG